MKDLISEIVGKSRTETGKRAAASSCIPFTYMKWGRERERETEQLRVKVKIIRIITNQGKLVNRFPAMTLIFPKKSYSKNFMTHFHQLIFSIQKLLLQYYIYHAAVVKSRNIWLISVSVKSNCMMRKCVAKISCDFFGSYYIAAWSFKRFMVAA